MQSRLLIVLLALATAGCIDQTSIQSRYARQHDDCRSYAEDHVDERLPQGRPVSSDERNAALVSLFSDCMAKKGWQVAKPKRADDAATPAVAVPAQQVNTPAVAPQPQPQAQPNAIPQPGPGTPTSPLATSPNPTEPTDTMPPPATYEPGYGSGPGRNF